MYKEFMIIIIVILLVVCIDVVTNNYTKDSVQYISNELNVLREYILNVDKESAINKMQEIKEKWKERYNILAFYIEHDELEKVETQMTGLAANINTGEFEDCISYLDTTIFILEHIQEKEEFHLRSIF